MKCRKSRKTNSRRDWYDIFDYSGGWVGDSSQVTRERK